MPYENRKRFITYATFGYAILAAAWIIFSDRMLSVIADADTITTLGTVKGIAFVAVTTILLGAALRHIPVEGGAPVPDYGRQPWSLLLVLLSLTGTIAVIATLAYRTQSASLKQTELERLDAVARLKVSDITRWMNERRANAAMLSHNPVIIEMLKRWLAHGGDADRERLLGVLREVRTSFGFANVELLDTAGRRLLSDGLNLSTFDQLHRSTEEAVRTRAIVFVDLHRHPPDNVVHMAYLAPILDQNDGGGRAIAVANLEMRADSYLYPYMVSWPLPSATGETVLARQEGDSVLYLNELRHLHDTALNLRIPLTSQESPAARSMLRQERLMEGLDYRQVRVLAAALPVPDTPWTLIAKVDETEALRSIRTLAFVTGVLILAALAVSVAFVGFLWQRQRMRTALGELARSRALEAAETRYQATFEYAAVGIFHVSIEGRFLEVNRHLCDILGYSREELLGKTYQEITHPDDLDFDLKARHRVLAGEIRSFSTEKRYFRRDGGTAWVALTSSLLRDASGHPDYFISTVVDISLRKAAERALRASEERFQLAVRGANDGLWDGNLQTDEVYYSPRWKSMLGYSEHELENNHETWKSLMHPDDLGPVRALMQDLQNGHTHKFEIEYRMRHRDGHYVNILSRAFVVEKNGKPVRLVGTHVDISELKAALAALQERVNLQDYLGKIAETLPGTICSFLMQPDGTTSMPYASPNFTDLCGLKPADVVKDATPAFVRIHPEDVGQVKKSILESAKRLRQWHLEFRVNHPDKGEIWVEGRSTPEREPNGCTQWHGFLHDITARKKDETRLRQAATVFASTHEGVCVTDPAGNIVTVNPAFTAITGYAETELVGKNPRFLQSGRHDGTFYRELWDSVTRDGYWQGEIWNRRKNGEIYPEWLTISAVRSKTGKVGSYIGTFTDISRIKQSEERLEYLAGHDALTDLPNRFVLLSRLSRAIERSARNGTTGAVLYLDLDRFKNVNDSLGHPAGDELLILVARRLRERLREGAALARFGGDEFTVLLEDVHDAGHAATVAQSVIDDFVEPFVLATGHEVYIGTSIGISLFPSDGEVANELIQHADAALYQAKDRGKGTYQFYAAHLTIAANVRLDMEARLRRALERNEFVLHYQPLVSIEDNRIKGLEALVRWQHPSDGLIAPDVFIPLAEETSLIIPLGDWVLRTACAQMKAWLSAGMRIDTVAVNLSPRQVREADICERVSAILSDTGLDGNHLELEITEGAIMDRMDDTETKLRLLKGLGVRLAIDDFGTGYSSLAYLKRFAIDKLKIDKRFVHDIPDDHVQMEIVAAIISMAKTLRLEVVAEGVETVDQLEALKAGGCDTAQGYLFSPALPRNEITTFLQLYAMPSAHRASAGTCLSSYRTAPAGQ